MIDALRSEQRANTSHEQQWTKIMAMRRIFVTTNDGTWNLHVRLVCHRKLAADDILWHRAGGSGTKER